MLGDNLAMDWHPIKGGVVILLVVYATETQKQLLLDGSQGLSADFSFAS